MALIRSRLCVSVATTLAFGLGIACRGGPDPTVIFKDPAAKVAAAVGARHDHVRKLLAAGANPNQADRMGNNAVHVAAQINEAGHVLEMLQAGAAPHAKNKQGSSFQRFLNQTPMNILNAESRAERERLHAWMRQNNVPVDAPAK